MIFTNIFFETASSAQIISAYFKNRPVFKAFTWPHAKVKINAFNILKTFTFCQST